MIPKYSLLVFTFAVIKCIFAQSNDIRGRLYIGEDVNDTTALYTYNENYVTVFDVPVYLSLYNITSGEILPGPPSTPVTVRCEISLDAAGYTQATFTPLNVPATDQTVKFTAPIPGRPNDLRCWGESQSGDEFTKAVSLSDAVLFEVRKAGSVSVAKSVITVANEAPNINVDGSFLVELSEVVELFNVTVSCQQDNTGVAAPMSLTFTSQRVITGNRKAVVPYRLVSRGDPVIVYCTAQSDNGNDAQFQSATSRGNDATFILAEGSVRLVPQRTNLKTTTLNAYLVLDALPTADLVFACYLSTADNSSHAASIAANPVCVMPDFTGPTRPPNVPSVTVTTPAPPPGPTTPAPPTPTQPTNMTGVWTLQQQVLVFESGSELYRPLVLSRTLNVPAALSELVVVTCCAPYDTNDSPKYENQSAALVAATYLTPYSGIQWDNATLSTDREVETELRDPAYVEVAPCPCDLTDNACDTDCCCDQTCSPSDIATFSCLPGIYGGDTSTPPDYMCDASPGVPRTDWWRLLCVQWNNSAYLGRFWQPEPVVRDSAGYEGLAREYRPESDYEEPEDRSPPEPPAVSVGYQEGRSVRTGLATTSATDDYHQGEPYKLALPAPSLGGACVWASPVAAFRETDHACTWTVTESLCGSYTPLSASIYAQSPRWSGAKGPVVLAIPGLNEVTETNVDYLCADSGAGYVPSGSTNVREVPGGARFDYDLPTEDLCSFDVNTGAYVCEGDYDAVAFADDPLPERCTFDDGFTQPPPAKLESGICTNAVLDVLYNFTWQGGALLTLNATIILGDIPMMSGPDNQTATQLTQNFEVLFTHQLQAESMIEDNSTDASNDTYVRPTTTEQYKRSGNPGYEVGRLVLTGVGVYTNLTDTPDTNSTSNVTDTADFLYVDANDTSTLRMWSPGADSLCLTAGTTQLEFGVSTLGSCVVQLSLEDLADCRTLRRLILNRQDALMPSGFVSRGGDPDYAYQQDWANIYREDLSWLLDNTTDNDTLTTASPSVTTVTTVTTPPTVTTETPGNTSTTGPGRLDTLAGRCQNVPDGVHVAVMYAEAGQRDGRPFYMVVGGKISYTLSTWRLSCSSSDGGACVSNVTAGDVAATQSFTLTSSVSYVLVPATEPKRVSSYRASHAPRVWQCSRDACWEELFYPFLAGTPGEGPQYTLTMGLGALIVTVAGVMALRPISRWDYIYPSL